MFIRWKKTGPHSFAAQLVECRRIDGKPRQKIIKHLATIYEGVLDEKKWMKRGLTEPDQFWYFVHCSLDELGDRLTPEERGIIEWDLMQRVPRPSDDCAAFPWRCPAGRPRGTHQPKSPKGLKTYNSKGLPDGPIIDIS
jgi:hypothetical protein